MLSSLLYWFLHNKVCSMYHYLADNGSVSTDRCASVVSRFLELDLEKDDVSAFLKDYVLPTAEGFL